MSFHLEIDASRLVGAVEDVELTDADDLWELAIGLCEILAEGGLRFTAGGFGQDPWPVDVRFDLSTLVPELPGILESARARAPLEIDLYEQGIQRMVQAEFEDDAVVLRCVSSGRWKPDPDSETTSANGFVEMLERLARDFRSAAISAVPRLADSPLIVFE